jgi:ABC-type amino acid transport system permease subunit
VQQALVVLKNSKGISSQSAAVYGVAALVFSSSAYVSEVYRAGPSSVHRSQLFSQPSDERTRRFLRILDAGRLS